MHCRVPRIRQKVGSTCPDCGKRRMLPLIPTANRIKRGIFTGRCKPCSQRGERHFAYKGSRRTACGYLRVQADTDKHSVNADGYILEHRMVMERELCRKLLPAETVHHRNGIRDDNRIENLELWDGKHGPGARKLDVLVDGINWLFSQQLQTAN